MKSRQCDRELEWQKMSQVPLHKVKDNLSKYIDQAADEEVVITRHGRAAVIIGFKDEDDWFDYRLENDERFLARIEQSRNQVRRGRHTLLEDLPDLSSGTDGRSRGDHRRPRRAE